MGAFANPKVKTDCLGDIDTPTVEELQKMHWSQYILHACNGKLTSISVEKNWLPRDPVVNPQGRGQTEHDLPDVDTLEVEDD